MQQPPMILNVQQNAPQQPYYQPPPSPQPMPVVMQQRKSDNSCAYFIVGVICCPCIFFVFMIILGGIGAAVSRDNLGPRNNPYNFTTEFSDQGSINSLIVGICDGDNEYSVSGTGTFQSSNYPESNYNSNSQCTNRFSSSTDGLTFDFTSFEIEEFWDNLVFRDDAGEQYAFTGTQSETRFSFASSFVDVHFQSDHVVQKAGFSVQVSDGYEEDNEVSIIYPDVKFTGETPEKEQ
ncbi:Oidioi.mRNA.OKI2018_I69.chr1.g629.t1.cds [Oikopleura dioica]|uniref:Oidioi.mRNA.OKI2018_I69.chr1.g629.t1.cds n=1 Tax=Oikopleura dioica TaxID=34765 RepID=A0ABN7SPN8_OIKDI|nr:Oidioi.mRNA.OKI2018_I69.chr1.g629.t1.cds [Oikopleura dioica]